MAQSVWHQRVVTQCIILIICMGMNFGVNFTTITPFNGMIWNYWGYKGFYSDSDLMQGVISASLIVGAMVGSLTMSLIIDKYGRKRPIGVLSGLSIVCCCLSALSQLDELNIWWLCITRALFGVPVGFLTGAGPIYVSEICPPEIRGRLNTMVQIFITIGILVAYGIGALIENLSCNTCEVVQEGGCYYDSKCYGNAWINLFLGFIWTVPLVIAIWWFPESYAVKSEENVREDENNSKKEDRVDVDPVSTSSHTSTKRDVSSSASTSESDRVEEVSVEGEDTVSSAKIKQASWKEIFSDYKRCVWFGFIVSLCQQVTGINAIIIYAPRIFSIGISDESLAKTLGGVGVSAWNCITTFVGLAFIDKAGRKLLLFLGFIVMGVGMLLMWIGNAFIMDINGTAAFVIMIVGVALFILAFEYGPGPIFYVLIGEMFPAEIKSKCAPVMNAIQWLGNLLVVFLFPVLDEAMNGWVWFIFLLFNILGGTVTWLLAVETKNVPLTKIRSMMYKPKNKN